MNDPHRIDSLEQLRELIPAPKATTAQKVTAALDEEARRFIAESPLLFVTTVDAQLKLDVSPKGDAPGFVRVRGRAARCCCPSDRATG